MNLFEKYPKPWRIVQDESVDPSLYLGGYEVYAANGETVMLGGTYSGDGDAEFNLNRLQVAELVALINKT
jgi:hypothetical protein